jgi:hypothetical protein
MEEHVSDDILTISKSKVLEAMERCPQAKNALETIFGEQVKPKEEWEDVTKKCFVDPGDGDGRCLSINYRPGVPNGGIVAITIIGPAAGINVWEPYKLENGRIWRRK